MNWVTRPTGSDSRAGARATERKHLVRDSRAQNAAGLEPFVLSQAENAT